MHSITALIPAGVVKAFLALPRVAQFGAVGVVALASIAMFKNMRRRRQMAAEAADVALGLPGVPIPAKWPRGVDDRGRPVPPGVLIVHAFPSWQYGPNGSPFVTKLEIFLRLAHVPYTLVTRNAMHPHTGKAPWVELDGRALHETELVIEELVRRNMHGARELDAALTPEQRATSLLLQRTFDEHLATAMRYNRWARHPDLVRTNLLAPALPRPLYLLGLPRIITNKVIAATRAHGLGLLRDHEIDAVALDDVRALAVLLGDKPFVHGARPSRVDATVAGQLAALLWSPFPSPVVDTIRHELPTIVAYLERIKALVYPDWADRCLRIDAGRIYDRYPITSMVEE